MRKRVRLCTYLLAAALACAAWTAPHGAVAAQHPLSFVPAWLTLDGRALPQHRGEVSLFPDTFGDPTPEGITRGPDGAIWFTDPGNDVIGRINAKGTFHMFTPPGGPEISTGITTGPDGALWFTTEMSSPEIGRLTTGGAFSFFPDGQGSYPNGITTGPDGALWFGETNGTIGRMTTTGSVSHVTVGPPNATMFGIVTGPDGALWATMLTKDGSHFGDEVVRVTTAGKVKHYTVGSGPAYICVGPDGALWFAEDGGLAIGRLTTAGAYTEYPLGASSTPPFGIAAGPDGALWFTLGGAARVGRITTKGKLQTFLTSATSFAITAGPGRAMWFTSSFNPSALGRIKT
jgi:streptogramin lyase